jgi:hypothetical protein
MGWPPAVADFKTKFAREFVYGTGLDAVTDNDIQRGLDEAGDGSLYSISNFDNPTQQANAYLYLAAHLMVVNIQGAGGLSAIPRGRGVRNIGEGIQVSKGVGQANVAYMPVPDRVASSPTLLYLFQTTFGQRYMQMVAPRLIGNVQMVAGYDDISGESVTQQNPV